MAYDNWHDAVAEIDHLTATVTSRQKALAAIGGIDLANDLPQLIAQFRLQAALADDIGLSYLGSKLGACSAYQLELIENSKGDMVIDVNAMDAGEASAWIGYFYLKSRRRALESLQLESGDIVELLESSGQFEEVSSIGGNGRIHFKGGAGAGAWPDKVSLSCKKSDQSGAAVEMKRKALNQAALRTRVGEWTEDKHRNLDEFEIRSPLASEDIEELCDVIETAKDERPIQEVIERRPQILGALLGGNPRFCVPKPQLGSEYEPDFFVGDVDSLGIRWVLVELETPTSSITLKTSNQLDQYARKGVSQISEWQSGYKIIWIWLVGAVVIMALG
jgi:hypothetical protein